MKSLILAITLVLGFSCSESPNTSNDYNVPSSFNEMPLTEKETLIIHLEDRAVRSKKDNEHHRLVTILTHKFNKQNIEDDDRSGTWVSKEFILIGLKEFDIPENIDILSWQAGVYWLYPINEGNTGLMLWALDRVISSGEHYNSHTRRLESVNLSHPSNILQQQFYRRGGYIRLGSEDYRIVSEEELTEIIGTYE